MLDEDASIWDVEEVVKGLSVRRNASGGKQMYPTTVLDGNDDEEEDDSMEESGSKDVAVALGGDIGDDNAGNMVTDEGVRRNDLSQATRSVWLLIKVDEFDRVRTRGNHSHSKLKPSGPPLAYKFAPQIPMSLQAPSKMNATGALNPLPAPCNEGRCVTTSSRIFVAVVMVDEKYGKVFDHGGEAKELPSIQIILEGLLKEGGKMKKNAGKVHHSLNSQWKKSELGIHVCTNKHYQASSDVNIHPRRLKQKLDDDVGKQYNLEAATPTELNATLSEAELSSNPATPRCVPLTPVFFEYLRGCELGEVRPPILECFTGGRKIAVEWENLKCWGCKLKESQHNVMVIFWLLKRGAR